MSVGSRLKSRYNRFFGALYELPSTELDRVTHFDRLLAETRVDGAQRAMFACLKCAAPLSSSLPVLLPSGRRFCVDENKSDAAILSAVVDPSVVCALLNHDIACLHLYLQLSIDVDFAVEHNCIVDAFSRGY